MSRPSSLVQVGVITSAHGIRGQVKIRSIFAQTPKELLAYGTLTDASGNTSYRLTACAGTDTAIVATIDGIPDRNAAELLRGIKLYAQEEKIPAARIGNTKLIGLKATLVDGQTYGEIIAVHNFGAGDIIEIKKIKGDIEMLPLKAPFAKAEKDRVIIEPPEYLEAANNEQA